jgi:nitrite reductase/ring-hydroxylating ferredoxin subunit
LWSVNQKLIGRLASEFKYNIEARSLPDLDRHGRISRHEGARMSHSVPAASVPEGTVTGVEEYAVGNNGNYFAVGRKCRHLRADLAGGSIDEDGCLVCPWHGSKYDVSTGRMVRGPQGIFAKIPGLGMSFKALTRVIPLKRGTIEQRGADLYID